MRYRFCLIVPFALTVIPRCQAVVQPTVKAPDSALLCRQPLPSNSL